MITFDTGTQIFHITTENTSYVMRLKSDYILEHLYYGKKLDNIKGIGFRAVESGIGFSSRNYETESMFDNLSTDHVMQEYTFFGSADIRKPSFHARYADGSRITKMKYTGHEIYDGKKQLDGLPATYDGENGAVQTLEITMRDELTGLELVLSYSAFEKHDAIARSVRAVNRGNSPIDINAIMSMNMDMKDEGFELIHLVGSWARERHIERKPLMSGTMKLESRRGSSSHHHSPFFALAKKETTEESGEVYGFSLLYSGNFEAGIEKDTYNTIRAFMGINSFDFNWLLDKGESFTAPETIMIYSCRGLTDMSQKFHRLYRKNLARGKWRDKERPILINNWEATYFDFDEEKILRIAEKAKSAGIELMVLDDGWFGKRNSDDCSLGDWTENREKLPHGIDGLAEKIEALGMKFGLWFEPEMISPDSDLYRAHPDWCLHVANRGRSEQRNQLILDLSRDDVCEYIISFLADMLKKAKISYVKWDMNRNMTEVGSALLPPERQAEVSHRYMLGLYRILETITSEFPDVLFEGCSGGGGRFDAGMMYYFSQYWTSDDTDAAERLYIQYGTSMVMPTAFMGAHVSAVPNHQTQRVTPMKLRGDVAICGQFGYELDITKMNDEEISEVKEQIALYKSVREIIHNGNMFRLVSPFESNRTAWEFVSEDKKTAVLCRYVIRTAPEQEPERIKMRGLNGSKNYRLRGTDLVFSGDVLMNYGWRALYEKDFDSEILIFDME